LVFTPGQRTITRSCYCNGLPVDSSICSPTGLPLVETRNCASNCMANNNCTWTNLTDWTDCLTLFNISTDDAQNFIDNPFSQQLCLRRECSCRQLNSSDLFNVTNMFS
jgi:hypothetical protein